MLIDSVFVRPVHWPLISLIVASQRWESTISINSKWSEMKVTQSCPTLCNPTDCIVHGILQARILGWVAYSFSRGSSWPRNRTGVSCVAGGFFTSWAIKEDFDNCRSFKWKLEFGWWSWSGHIEAVGFIWAPSLLLEGTDSMVELSEAGTRSSHLF